MPKRGFEARWMEFCEGEPIEVVRAMLRLGKSILAKRTKQQREKFKGAIPESLLKPEPLAPPELFERDKDGEPVAPF